MTNNNRKPLEARISTHKNHLHPYCKKCEKPGHWTSNCRKLGKKCYGCGKLGHLVKNCWGKARNKKGERNTGGGKTGIKEQEEAHVIAAAFLVIEGVDEEMYNFDTYDANNAVGMDEHCLYYDWLGDSATTSHVVAQ